MTSLIVVGRLHSVAEIVSWSSAVLARRIWATRPLAWTAIEVSETTFVWLEVLTTPAKRKQADHAAPRTAVVCSLLEDAS